MSRSDKYMLMFSLGPVQIFIEQARKARDLWVGSLLLSSLMQEAMREIPGQFIFPAVRQVGKTPDIPNKYVALFDSREQAQLAAEKSERQVKAYWQRICSIVWEKVILPHAHGDETTSQIWQRQTRFESLFEIYWVFTPRKGNAYNMWLDETEQLFAARKRLRNFQQQNEPGEKSAISGEREILRTSKEQANVFWKKVAALYSPKDIAQDGTEHLDAIDTIKRFAMRVNAGLPDTRSSWAFPSTSSIATAPFLEQVLAQAAKLRILSEWYKATGDNHNTEPLTSKVAEDIPYLKQRCQNQELEKLLRRDGDLYFPSTFTPNRLKKDYNITDKEVARQGKAALKDLLSATSALNITSPTPYYGIIQMDGDNMGILLSSVENEQEHETMSRALSEFAHLDALPLIEQAYPARLIYAGGDDVQAFAPLARDSKDAGETSNILELVYDLQSRYQKRIRDALPPSQDKAAATASMGIAIAHHYTSLSYTIRTARAAEEAAKKHYGKNALVVTLIRRSGEQTQVGCHWHYPTITEQDGQPIQLFTRFYTLFKEDVLSPKCVYILLEEAPGLIGLVEDAQASEMKRVLLRQLTLNQKSDQEKIERKLEVERLATRLTHLATAMDMEANEHLTSTGKAVSLARELHSSQRRYGLVESFGWLLAMAFLARKDREQE